MAVQTQKLIKDTLAKTGLKVRGSLALENLSVYTHKGWEKLYEEDFENRFSASSEIHSRILEAIIWPPFYRYPEHLWTLKQAEEIVELVKDRIRIPDNSEYAAVHSSRVDYNSRGMQLTRNEDDSTVITEMLGSANYKVYGLIVDKKSTASYLKVEGGTFVPSKPEEVATAILKKIDEIFALAGDRRIVIRREPKIEVDGTEDDENIIIKFTVRMAFMDVEALKEQERQAAEYMRKREFITPDFGDLARVQCSWRQAASAYASAIAEAEARYYATKKGGK